MSKSAKLSLALLLLAALAIRWWGVDGVDVGTDEPSYTLNGDIYVKALLSGELYEKTKDLKKEHPPVANWLYGLAFQAQRLGWKGFFFYRAPKRLAGLLMVAAALVVFLIGRRLGDDWTGLLAAALLAFMPHGLAHSRIAGLEAPSVLAWAGGLYCFLRAVEPGAGLRWLALLGLVFGLAVGVKMTNGLMALAGLLSLMVLWGKQGQGLARPARLWPWLLVPAVGLLAFWAAWPRLWHQPWTHLLETLAHWEFGAERDLSQWGMRITEPFLGQDRVPPPYYYLVYLGVTTPPLVLAGLLAWLIHLIRRRETRDLVLLPWLLAPLLLSFVLPRQDGIRYVLPLYVALVLAAARGVTAKAERLAGRLAGRGGRLGGLSPRPFLAGLGGLVVASCLWAVASFWPYHLDYYNAFAGRVADIHESRRFRVGWWGEGVQAGVAYLNKALPQGTKVAFHPENTGHVVPLRPDLRLVGTGEADFALSHIDFDKPERWQGWRVVFEERFKGAPLSRVYQRGE